MHYETLNGEMHELAFDFGMLLPPFGGVPLRGVRPRGHRHHRAAVRAERLHEGRRRLHRQALRGVARRGLAQDLPVASATDNVFAVGIAFAPPHQISRPRKSTNGTVIAPSPPRTGMPSGVMGKTAALTIVDRIKHGDDRPAHEASMATMGAACVASAGAGMRRGSAAAMTMMPVVPDYTAYPTGRDLADTRGEIGLQRPLGQADDALPVHLQGQGPPRLAADPGVSDMTDEHLSPTPDPAQRARCRPRRRCGCAATCPTRPTGSPSSTCASCGWSSRAITDRLPTGHQAVLLVGQVMAQPGEQHTGHGGASHHGGHPHPW